MSQRHLSSKNLVFIALMGALGNVLSAISITVAPIVPSIPIGPLSVSLALDLSHTTTFIAAFFGGSFIGGLTGLIGGAVAAYKFGFSSGNFITGFGLPIGKAMTGITAGFLMKYLNPFESQKIKMISATVASYIPEGLFTTFIFIIIFPLFFPMTPLSFLIPFTAQIIIKAFAEMIILGLILSSMVGNRGFTEYVKGFFTKPLNKA